jgi:tRNA (guanine-N7-)-methyltransferase
MWSNFAMQQSDNKSVPSAEHNFDHVKSFVKRKGHFTASRRDALESLWPKFGVEYSALKRLDLQALFGNANPVVLEIGFGMGITTAEIAENNPHINYLGVEVYGAGVASLMKLIGEKQLQNVRAIQHDVFDVIRDMMPHDSLSGIHLFFPDPWPKARHHKRRLLQTDFITRLHPALKAGAYLHCATDWENYAEHMLTVLQASELYANTSKEAPGYSMKPSYRPLTKFEDRGLKLGHGVWDLIFRKA